MNSNNFLPLKSRWPQLYQLAAFAEHYALSDPHTSVIKLRCFAEVLVGFCFRKFELRCEPGDGFFEKLDSQEFQVRTPKPAKFVHFLKIVSYSQSIPAKTTDSQGGLRPPRGRMPVLQDSRQADHYPAE
jgi:hypothetical protein